MSIYYKTFTNYHLYYRIDRRIVRPLPAHFHIRCNASISVDVSPIHQIRFGNSVTRKPRASKFCRKFTGKRARTLVRACMRVFDKLRENATLNAIPPRLFVGAAYTFWPITQSKCNARMRSISYPRELSHNFITRYMPPSPLCARTPIPVFKCARVCTHKGGGATSILAELAHRPPRVYIIRLQLWVFVRPRANSIHY